MSPRPSTTSHSNNVGHSSPRASSNSQHSRSSPSNSSPIDPQTLLSPVVRSKRTPIACTECRRRQVKCTGATPQCERCEKKGVKCQYIPCSQQKANAATSAHQGSQSPIAAPSYSSGHSQYPSPQWQQSVRSGQGSFVADSTPNAYSPQVDWRGRSSLPSSQPLSQHQTFSQQPIQVPSQSYNGADYHQATYSPEGSFHQQGLTRGGGSVSQAQYPPSGYQGQGGYSRADLVVPSLPYGYGETQSRMAPQMVTSNHSSYTNDYYPSGNEVFTASGMVSEASDKSWDPYVHNQSFLSYHGTPYP